MDFESTEIPLYAVDLDEALAKITKKPKRKYSQQEINEARDNLALMHDRVFFGTFADNKNNHIIKGLADALRKLHAMPQIPPIERTTVQKMSLRDVFERGMVGDLLGEALMLNIALEAQRKQQDGFAVRGTISSGNAMRVQFRMGDKFTEAPDVIGINILGFRLPELKNKKMFCSRIVRADYDTKDFFLADKYSDFYIELPKMKDWTKDKLPEEYHDLWDICCIFKAKVKNHKEVIKLQSIANPTALALSNEVVKTVAPSIFMDETLERRNELEDLRDYFLEQFQEAAKEAAKESEKAAKKLAEDMLIIALQGNTAPDVIEAMKINAAISDTRLAELRILAQSA